MLFDSHRLSVEVLFQQARTLIKLAPEESLLWLTPTRTPAVLSRADTHRVREQRDDELDLEDLRTPAPPRSRRSHSVRLNRSFTLAVVPIEGDRRTSRGERCQLRRRALA